MKSEKTFRMFGTLINLLFLNNLIKGFYMKGIRALCLWFFAVACGRCICPVGREGIRCL